MNVLIIPGILALLAGCAASADRQTPPPADTTHQEQPPPPPGGPQSPAAVKENMSMIGAVLTQISLLDDYRYVLTLELRTALPSGGAESMAESGQTVVVYPEYILGNDGEISLDVERNRRLFVLRKRKPGEAVLGRISLHADGTWHLIDTEFK